MRGVTIAKIEVHQDPAGATATVALRPAPDAHRRGRNTRRRQHHLRHPHQRDDLGRIHDRHLDRGHRLHHHRDRNRNDATWGDLDRQLEPGFTNLTDPATPTGTDVAKPDFGDVTAQTRTGYGTVALFSALTRGTKLSSVEIAGCETSTCVQSTVLNDDWVAELTIGSPTLLDDTTFLYSTIKWDRNDGLPGTTTKSFGWNVFENIGL